MDCVCFQMSLREDDSVKQLEKINSLKLKTDQLHGQVRSFFMNFHQTLHGKSLGNFAILQHTDMGHLYTSHWLLQEIQHVSSYLAPLAWAFIFVSHCFVIESTGRVTPTELLTIYELHLCFVLDSILWSRDQKPAEPVVTAGEETGV